MKFLKTLQELAYPLETSEFYRNIAIFLGTLIVLTTGIIYFHHTKTASLRISLQKMYKLQQEAKVILEKQKVVQKQREEVNILLEEDKSFKLKSFFDEIVSRLGLSSYQVKEAEVSDDVLQKLYTEIKINVQFRGITTKQLCELLQAIEQKSRVYTKDLTIIKRNNALEVTLTIATLKSAIIATKKG